MLRNLILGVFLGLVAAPATGQTQVGVRGGTGLSSVSTTPRTLSVLLQSGRSEGLPIHWTTLDAVLLQRDGGFRSFEMDELRSHQLLEEPFTPQSLPEARGQLAAELGVGFETIVAAPYVIAAPRGSAARWQERFTRLQAGYWRYFEVRGWPLRKPDFPLIVIVFPDRASFLRYASTQVGSLPDQAVGCYFPRSNRCILYQIGHSKHTDWSATEATVVHEAIHQLAYNTGVHERLFENPLWFVEGLATMFEESAVYDTRAARSAITDRMNASMLARLRPMLADPVALEQKVHSLITSDDFYRSNALDAYALGWAMTFTVAERMPREFGDYIQLQTRRGMGQYSAGQRQADFRDAFHTSPDMLAYQMRKLLGN
ncbi:MAG: DUF1570 domain-containing protein [Pirellulaceae bacterium]